MGRLIDEQTTADNACSCLEHRLKIVAEELPKEHEPVLLQDNVGNFFVGALCEWIEDVFCFYDDLDDKYDLTEIYAWMPLPEPLKKGGVEK